MDMVKVDFVGVLCVGAFMAWGKVGAWDINRVLLERQLGISKSLVCIPEF